MPIYDYCCPHCQAWMRARRGMSNRTDAPDCLSCGHTTTPGIRGLLAGEAPAPMEGVAVSETVYRPERGLLDAKTGRRYRLVDVRCTAEGCGHTEDTTEAWLDAEGEYADPAPTCLKCGGAARYERVLDAHSRFSEIFPYFDQGAGRWFHSARERREWMRANGLVEAGDITGPAERWARKADDEDRRVNARYAETIDQYQNDPALREAYGQLVAQGRGAPKLA